MFETDTNRIIVWDDNDSVWRVYNSDSIALNTLGTNELHYPLGLWSSASATHYISVSPEIHFDASIMDGADSANNPSDGGSVSSWGNRSGSSTSYTATQASAGSQPTWASSSNGSKPAVIFDGGDKLTLANEWTGAGDFTQITVSKSDHANKAVVTAEVGSAYASTVWWRYSGNTDDYFLGNRDAHRFETETFHMHTITRTGTTYDIRENGGSAINTATDSTTVKVGQIGNIYLEGHDGDISEILVFNSQLSNSNLSKIGDYIDAKYGLSTATFS